MDARHDAAVGKNAGLRITQVPADIAAARIDAWDEHSESREASPGSNNLSRPMGSLMCCENAAALLGGGGRIKTAHIFEVPPA